MRNFYLTKFALEKTSKIIIIILQIGGNVANPMLFNLILYLEYISLINFLETRIKYKL